MTCGIKNVLENNARVFLETLGLKEGDVLTLDAFSQYEERLNKFQGGNLSLYELRPDSVYIKIEIPDIIADSYEQTAAGETSDYERANDSDYSPLLLDNIRSKFDEDWPSFVKFIEDSLLSVQQILKINGDSIPVGLKPELIQLRQALIDSREDPSFERAFISFGQYLVEGDKLSEIVLAKIKELTTNGKEDNFIASSQLASLITPYRAVVDDLFASMVEDNSNKLKDMITRLKTSIDTIDSIHLREAEKFSVINYDKLLAPSRKQFEKQITGEIAQLEKHILNSSGRVRDALISKVEKLKRDLSESPNKGYIEKLLKGEFGDSSFIKKWIGAAMTNGDIIVQGFNLAIKNAMDGIFDRTNQLRHEMAKAYDEFKQSTGVSDFNGQEFVKKFLVETEIFYFNKKEGKIDSYKKYNLLHSHSNERFSVISRFEAQLEEADSRKDLAEIERIKTELDRYLGENFERPHADNFYKAEELLDVRIGGRTVRERRKEIFDTMGFIKSDIKANGGLVTQDQIEAMNDLWTKYDALRSKTNPDGSPKTGDDLAVAQTLEEYSKLRRTVVSYEISEYNMLQFEKQKKEIDKLTDKEAKARWYYFNTKQEIEPRWFEDRLRIENSMSRIVEAIGNLVGSTKNDIQVRYKDLRDIANKYRDNNGIINGVKSTVEEQERTKQIEEQIKRLRKFQGLGLSDDQSNRLEQLINEKEVAENEMTDPNPSVQNAAYKRISTINKEIKSIKAEMPLNVRVLVEKVTQLMEELSKISMTTNTHYYTQEYEKQYNLFLNDKKMVDDFEFDGYRFSKQEIDGKITYVKSYQDESTGEIVYETVSFDDAHNAFVRTLEEEFQQSEWFIRNHILSWDAATKSNIYKPTYLWKHTRPTPEYSTKEDRPNRNWSSTKIQPNPNYRDIDGKPVPKADKLLDTKYGSLVESDKKFLDFLTNKFMKAQEAYAPHDRLGYSIPMKEKAITILDTIQNQEVKAGWKVFKRKWKATSQDIETEGVSGINGDGEFKLGDSAGEMTKFVPVKFKSKLDLDITNTNFFQTIFEYGVGALEYEALNSVIPLLEATDKTLSNPAYAPKSKDLNVLGRKFGILRKLKIRGENERLSTIRNNANMLIYGEQDVDATFLGLKWNKIFNNLMGYDAFKILAGSIPNQAVNLFGGIIQQIIRTGTGVAPYTFKQWMQAHKEYGTKYAGQLINDLSSIDRSYIGQLMEYFDVFNIDTDIKDRSLIKNMMSSDLVMMPKNFVEHELNATTFLAIAKNVSIDGMNLLEAFELRDGVLTPKFQMTEENQEKVLMTRRKANAMIRDVNGNYAKLDKTLAEKYWVGRAIFFMKKFIIPMVESRYGGKRYSAEHGRFVEGYYRAWARFTWESKGKDLLTLLPIGDQSHLTEDEKYAINQMRKEIILLAIMWVLGSVVMGYDDDDKDRFKKLKENHWFYNWVLYTVLKTRSEAETFVVPFGFDEIRKQRDGLFRELFPLFDNIWAVTIKDINYFPPGLEKYEKSGPGYKKGDVKLVHDLYKILGKSAPKYDAIQSIRNLELLKKK